MTSHQAEFSINLEISKSLTTTLFNGVILMKKNLTQLTTLAAGCALLLLSGQGIAAGLITNGNVALGVLDTGRLNLGHSGATIFGPDYDLSGSGTVGGTGVRGVFLNDGDGDGLNEGYEATYPGCLCEGWGVAVASLGISGWDGNGTSNVTALAPTFGTDGSGFGIATTVATIADGTGAAVLEVTHDFRPSDSEWLYQVDVTIRNISGGDLGSGATDLRYTRLMDWDTEPTPFDEYVTIQGHPADNLLNTSDDGFESANPLLATTSIASCAPEGANFTDCGPTDHGARFDFGFDALLGVDDPTTVDVDETMRMFTIFYGAAPTEALADAARALVGMEVYSYGQCDSTFDTRCSEIAGTPITYIFGFQGVGGTAPGDEEVPLPGTLLLLGIGLAGLGWRHRKTART